MIYNPLKTKRFIQKMKVAKMYKLHNRRCLRDFDILHLFQRPIFGSKLIMIKDFGD